jgi:hypothetical protein
LSSRQVCLSLGDLSLNSRDGSLRGLSFHDHSRIFSRSGFVYNFVCSKLCLRFLCGSFFDWVRESWACHKGDARNDTGREAARAWRTGWLYERDVMLAHGNSWV